MLIKIIAAVFAAAIAAWSVYALIPTAIYKYRRDNTLFRFGGIGKNCLQLTFDDGPDPEYTPQVLSILAEYGVKAIFFLPAFKAAIYPSLVAAIKASGHTVGMHGSDHRSPLFMTPRATKSDFDRCIAAFAGEKNAAFYRPPHGCVNLTLLRKIKKADFRLILWSVCARDWLNRGEDVVLESLNRQLAPGAVILLHDSGEDTGGEQGAAACTVSALKKFIPMALAKGYVFADPRKLEETDGKTA